MATLVNVENFARAESARMFAALATDAGVNELVHHRVPASIDHQPVIRQNRDTLYSSAVGDISHTAILSIPDAGDRPTGRSRCTSGGAATTARTVCP